MSKSTWVSRVCLIFLLGSILGIQPVNQVWAQSAEELELVDLINALRVSQGLAAYTVDPALMTMAHEHSVFQAYIHESTHLHSDGRTPPQIGVVENVAGGDLGWITPQTAIYDIWMGDAVHAKTLVGYASGAMGVGIADDGVTAYYTLELIPGDGTSAGATLGVGDDGSATPYTPITLVPLLTMTPLPDGTIVHVVGYGQTLWSIALAYGITVDQIRAWNNIPPDSTDIYVGQRLLVLPASLVTLPITTQAVTSDPAFIGSNGFLADAAVSATSSPTRTLAPAPSQEQSEQMQVSRLETTSQNELIPEQALGRDGFSVLTVFAVMAILGGLALLVILLRKKTSSGSGANNKTF